MKILIIIILPIIYTYRTKRNLKNSQKKVKEDWNKIDSILKTRNDIIPELIEIAKKHINEEMLSNINKTRNDLIISKTKEDKIINSNKLTNELGYLFSITEDYVDLKENGKFLDVQSKLHDTEDQLTKSKKKYNNSALIYKNKIKGFPSNIVAYVFKFKPAIIFKDAEKKEIQKELKEAEVEEVEVLKL